MGPGGPAARPAVVARLARAGCVAAEEEADELLAAAGGDVPALARMVRRRERGEPLAWVTGTTRFAGQEVRVDEGVYVPRWQTEPLARRAAELLPERGTAADLCTGAGAVALVLAGHRRAARVVAADIDPAACRCAAANGVDVYCGHLADPLPADVHGRCDVVTAVPPYVPHELVPYLPSDARDHEPHRALDGGPGGLAVLVEVVAAAAGLLRPGGTLLAELGGDQDAALAGPLATAGFALRERLVDGEGDLRGIAAVLAEAAAHRPT